MNSKIGLIPEAEPYLFQRGPTGVLLIHGMPGTPKETRELGEYLAEGGFTCLGIRLPGHATKPEDLSHVRWEDWYHAVEDGWNLLNTITTKLCVVGLSLGGVLGLILASKKQVDGLATISAVYQMPDDIRLKYIDYLSIIKPTVSLELDTDISTEINHIMYPHVPTKVYKEVTEATEYLRDVIGKVDSPITILHSETETPNTVENAHKIYQVVSSKVKELHIIKSDTHNLLISSQRFTIFSLIRESLNRFSGDQIEP